MKRIFYFTGHRLIALHWSGKTLISSCSFEPDDEGLIKFEQYLNSVVKVRTRLLVDVIEEDFRVESVPHVYGKDKAAVTKRLLDRYYRASNNYTYAEVLGRQKFGRKDDEVLLGAITNPKLLEPWLTVIESCEVPLSGIWTLPLVSKALLPYLHVKQEAVLLVSQQVGSNLRQTFFKNKKLISSRTSVINQDEIDKGEYGSIVNAEIGRTLAYIRGQGHIQADDVIDVHIISSREQIQTLESNLVSDNNYHHYIHDLASIENSVGLSGLNGEHADGLFAWLCLKNITSKYHYGVTQLFRQYYYSLASSALYAASILTLVIGILVTEANVVDIMQYSHSINLLNEEKEKFQNTYDEKFKEFESVLSDAKIIDSSIKLYNRIKKGSEVNPLDFFVEFSKTLASANTGDVSIDQISWSTQQIINNRSNKRNKKKEKTAKTNLVLNYPVQHVATIKGRIPISSNDYRASVKRIDAIVDALKNNPRVTLVKVLEMPVEVRSEKQFSADGGVSATTGKLADEKGVFSLEIIMQANSDA